MIGLMFLGVAIFWLGLTAYLTIKVPHWLGLKNYATWLLRLVLVPLLVLGPFVTNHAELAEVYKKAICGQACPSLTATELKLRVIKAYLHYRLSVNIQRLEFASREKLVLLPANLNAENLAQGLRDSTLLTTLTTNTLLLKTHEQIDALEPEILTTHPSIAEYSLSSREATVIPIQSIQPIRLEDLDPSLEPHAVAARRIGRWERLRGYGNNFFQITEYWGLDLSCCDGQGDHGGTSLYRRKKSSLDFIQFQAPRIFAASDCGAILFWKIPGENHLFFRLLPTNPPTIKEHL